MFQGQFCELLGSLYHPRGCHFCPQRARDYGFSTSITAVTRPPIREKCFLEDRSNCLCNRSFFLIFFFFSFPISPFNTLSFTFLLSCFSLFFFFFRFHLLSISLLPLLKIARDDVVWHDAGEWREEKRKWGRPV